MRAAIYARVSTSDQDADNQLPGCRALIAQRGWDLVGEYCDTSGGSGDRPERVRLLRDAHAGRVQVIVVWALDRWSRAGVETVLRELRELRDRGVDVVSVTEPEITGAVGELMRALLAWFAAYERTRRSERAREGYARVRRELAGGRSFVSARGYVRTSLGRPRAPVDPDALARAVSVRAAGGSWAAAAAAAGVPATTLRRAVRT